MFCEVKCMRNIPYGPAVVLLLDYKCVLCVIIVNPAALQI